MLVLVILLGVSVPVLAHPTSQTCAVSEVYQETIAENRVMLLKVLGMINSPSSPLDDARTARLNYTMLLSTRHHHENVRANLSACAQELKTATIDVVAASQDVIGLKLAQDANPGHRRYEQHNEQAKAHLDGVWARLFEVSEGLTLTQL